MTQIPTEPKVEWGFFAATPRILRTNYKQLSHSEKWLYVCLKDICGDKGVCFRSLRSLAIETDLSIGSLSTGIRHLHEAGLIHAAKKRRSNNPTAKEVWHITIVDIWQENAAYCSKNEHSSLPANQDNVQILNKGHAQKRSKNEQKRSKFDDRRTTHEEQPSKEEQPFVQTEKIEDSSFVTLPRDGGASHSEEHEEAGVSHSQWLSESIQQKEEVPAPGGGTPTGSTVQAPAPSLKGIQPLQPTRNDATGQARPGHATDQSTRTPASVIAPPSITETDENGKYKKPQERQFKQPSTHSADEPRQFTHDMTLTPEEMKRRGYWQHHFNALRGGELLDKIGPRHEERYCIGYLVAKYTDEQITALVTFYQTEEPYWKKPENRVRMSGIILWEKQQEGATYLKLMNRWPLRPGEAPVSPPTPVRELRYAPWSPHEEIIPYAAQAH